MSLKQIQYGVIILIVAILIVGLIQTVIATQELEKAKQVITQNSTITPVPQNKTASQLSLTIKDRP